uniref:G-protein coupled receptors family 3 profile domain-containing protein n=1 Tax=Electrophorus electricus TaxID=8005 RepID=A0A4W4GRF5_ELEEL
MENRPNCSADCESASCFIQPAVNSQQSGDILLRLCTLVMEVQSRSLSPVLCAVVWTLLSCGILLAFLFLIFTIRYKNNRIVKMSSPNLNMLTLVGSVFTYTSGFLFAIEDRSPIQGAGARAVLMVRVWMLCVGSSLVFGPILGKTWRLYRVFTQRVPDKRVIIRDIQLMFMVALLIMVDVVLLSAWGLTDPAECSRSVSAVVKVLHWFTAVRNTVLVKLSCPLLQGSVLLYGTYLAGLTSNVSLPPVNQTLPIVAAVCLTTASTAVAVPISRYLYAWPNLVYGVVSGAIFICTTVINCLLFVPQLSQWKQFEEEVNPHSSQMAKYFNSPGKSLRSIYSEDEIFYLLGEHDSMKRLISEKNAVIDSLQEQVNSAKDKLLKLMSVSHLQAEGEMSTSATNLNSSSTRTTLVPLERPPEPPPSPLPVRSVVSTPPAALSPPPYMLPPSLPDPSSSLPVVSPPRTSHSPDGASQNSEIGQSKPESESLTMYTDVMQSKVNIVANSKSASVGLGSSSVGDILLHSSVNLNKLEGSTRPSPAWSSPSQGYIASSAVDSIVPSVVTGVGCHGYVSSEQLQEILQDLSVDAVRNSLRSPNGVRKTFNPVHDDLSSLITFSPLAPLSPLSPQSHLQFCFPSISPYMMRKRRPPFHSSRTGSPPYYYPGSAPPGCRRASAPSSQERLRECDSKKAQFVTANSSQCRDSQSGDEEGSKSEGARHDSNAPSQSGRRASRRTRQETSSKRRPISPLAGHVNRGGSAMSMVGTGAADLYGYSDSESSSSEDYSYYHRPYCEACLHHPYASNSESSSTSETSDSEYMELYHSSHPVVNFKDDLKPTLV